jgi:hypothetical protein
VTHALDRGRQERQAIQEAVLYANVDTRSLDCRDGRYRFLSAIAVPLEILAVLWCIKVVSTKLREWRCPGGTVETPATVHAARPAAVSAGN